MADPEGSAAAAVIAALVARGETVATCESLTGGLLGATLTAVAGSSAAYRGGLVSYATDLKHTLAGVPQDLLDAEGAVAADTAVAMARGTAERCGADWGLATTGVAGPDPQEGHPRRDPTGDRGPPARAVRRTARGRALTPPLTRLTPRGRVRAPHWFRVD